MYGIKLFNDTEKNRVSATAFYKSGIEPINTAIGDSVADAITTLILKTDRKCALVEVMKNHKAYADNCLFLKLETSYHELDDDLDCHSVWVRHCSFEYRITLDGLVRGLYDYAGFRVWESSGESVSTESFSTFKAAFTHVVGLIAEDVYSAGA